jgi:hypothetical protein
MGVACRPGIRRPRGHQGDADPATRKGWDTSPSHPYIPRPELPNPEYESKAKTTSCPPTDNGSLGSNIAYGLNRWMENFQPTSSLR